jgi:hypothetical protein
MKIKLLIGIATILGLLTSFSFATNTELGSDMRGWYGSSPVEILDRVAGQANKNIAVQETAIDWVTDEMWGYPRQYKISNTLEYLRINIAPYIQWVVYIGLVVAVILVMYNWFLMVTHSIHSQWDFAKIQGKLKYIAIGILLLTWFYTIIKLVVGLVNSIFWTNWGSDTWF